MVKPARFVVDFESVDIDDRHLVGDHAARFGNLKKKNVLLPKGFVILPQAYFEFFLSNNLDTKVGHLLGSINFTDESSINQVAKNIKKLIKSSLVPAPLALEIFQNYEKIGGTSVKLHTSVVSGHTAQNEFPREYFLDNITGEASLVDFIRDSWASIFDPALIIFRNKNGIDHVKTGISTVVQEVMDPILSGKILTRDAEFRGKENLVLETDSGRFILNKEKGVERRLHGKSPIVFVKEGSTLVPESVVDENILNSAFQVASALEDSFEGHEISWIKSGNNFYVTGVQPLNLYG